jgi:hypothetical protein
MAMATIAECSTIGTAIVSTAGPGSRGRMTPKRRARSTRGKAGKTVETLDVKARYAHAKALLAAGKLDKATTEFVWLWQHMLEHQPSMCGVRVSFMAATLQTLAKKHPPARARFRALRDELNRVVDSGTPDRKQLQDWAVLCKVVGQNNRVLQWFDRTGPNFEPPREHRWVIDCSVIPLLKRQNRWADIGRLYRNRNPLHVVRSASAIVADMPRIVAKHPKSAAEIRKSIERHFLGTVGTLCASLCAASHDIDAQEVFEEARKTMPGERLDKAIMAALKAARFGARRKARTMEPRCSFCGKSQTEVDRLIAGPSVFICNECVRLCADFLDDPASPLRRVEARTTSGEVRQGLVPGGVPQVLIRVPDGSAHAGEPSAPWKPLVVFGEKLEWCVARSAVRGSAPLLIVAVRRRGADGPAVGVAFNANTSPTRGRAKEIAIKYLLGRE